MSTSLLYNMFGIRGDRHLRTDYFQGAASFVVEQPREKYRCPVCGSAAVNAQGKSPSSVATPRERSAKPPGIVTSPVGSGFGLPPTIYDKEDERKLRIRLGLFEEATHHAGHKWVAPQSAQ